MKDEPAQPARSRLDELQDEIDALMEQNLRLTELKDQFSAETANAQKQYVEVMKKLEEEANTRNHAVGLLNDRETELAKTYQRIDQLAEECNTADKYINLLEKAYAAQSATMQAMLERKNGRSV